MPDDLGLADLAEAIRTTARTSRWRAEGLNENHLARGEWRHPAHGIVRPRDVLLDRVDDYVSVAVATMGPRHALGGWAAGYVQGVAHVDGARGASVRPVLVHCMDGAQLRRRQQVRPSESVVLDGEVCDVHGINVAILARAGFDEACDAKSLDDAVVVLDSFVAQLRGGARTTRAEIDRVISRHPKHRGIVQARAALSRVSVRALSPWETRLRVRAEDVVAAGDLLVYVPVFSRDGRLLGVPDLLDRSSGLVLESDGAAHRQALAHANDNRREERFEDHLLEVVRFRASDHADAADVARRIEAGRHRALRHPPAERGWTLELPGWWQRSRLARIYRWP